jgi:circadian clock protein KaiB
MADTDQPTPQPADAVDPGRLELRLYVSGSNARSLAAIQNLKAILENHAAGRYDLEVVDLFQNPSLRDRDQVLALPTLVKCAPPPARRLIGDLSDTPRVLSELGLLDAQAQPPIPVADENEDDARPARP